MAFEPSILVAGISGSPGILYRLFWNPTGGAGQVDVLTMPFSMPPVSAVFDFGPIMLVNDNMLYISVGGASPGLLPIWRADFRLATTPGSVPDWTFMCTLPVSIDLGEDGRPPGRVDHNEVLWTVQSTAGVPAFSSYTIVAIDLNTGALKYSIDGPASYLYDLGFPLGVLQVFQYPTFFLPVTINTVDYMAVVFFEGPFSRTGRAGTLYLIDINTGAVVTNASPIWSFTPSFNRFHQFPDGPGVDLAIFSECSSAGGMSFDGSSVYVSADFFIRIDDHPSLDVHNISQSSSFKITKIDCLSGAVTDIVNTSGGTAVPDSHRPSDAISYTFIDYNSHLLYCCRLDASHTIYQTNGAGPSGLLPVGFSSVSDISSAGLATPQQQYGYVDNQLGTYFDFGPGASSPEAVSRIDTTSFTVIDTVDLPQGWGISQPPNLPQWNWAYMNCKIDGIVALCVCTDTTLEFR